MNLPVKASPAEIIETVLIKSDLAKLTAEERMSYYTAICQSTGLNPLTKPFEFIVLNGKLTLYALKGCTDQLRAIHDISVVSLTKEIIDGVLTFTASVRNDKGRTDEEIGAVNITGLKGDALANAMMKASTKAKRRATLSICGLGMLDESELDTIPRESISRVPSPPPPRAELQEAAPVHEPSKAKHQKPHRLNIKKDEGIHGWTDRYITAMEGSVSMGELVEWDTLNDETLQRVDEKAPKEYQTIIQRFEALKARLMRDSISTGPIEAPKANGPDFKADYDAWMSYHLDKIRHATDGGELETYWNAEIEPLRGDLMPPDYAELCVACGAKHEELKGLDGE